MVVLSSVFVFVVAVAGFFPGYQPPSCGVGSEMSVESVRAFSMGGVAAGVPSSGMVDVANPSASAWAEKTGLSLSARTGDTTDSLWSGVFSFPDVSMMMPLPLGLQISAVLTDRSEIRAEDPVSSDSLSGTIDWTGSSGESYIGVTKRLSDNFALSVGGKCFFGSALGTAVTSPENPGSQVPVSTYYRDDLVFSPSWSPLLGLFMKTDVLSIGFSVLPDRSGELDIQRSYIGGASADSSYRYSLPGEIYSGVSVRPHSRVLLGMDLFARKAVTLLGETVPEGHYTAAGLEIDPGGNFLIRAGVRSMSGLWRDGALRFSGGAAYMLPGNVASFEVAASHETWGLEESETVFFTSIRISENWLGR